MNRHDLILATALRMDEVSPSNTPLAVDVDASDNNPLYTLINGLLDESLVEVYTSAPWWRLNQKSFFGATLNVGSVVGTVPRPSLVSSSTSLPISGAISISTTPSTVVQPAYATKDNVTGRFYIPIPVPSDFLKIAEITCSGFQRPITQVFSEGSDMAKRQHNRWLVAKVAKPVAVMSHNGTSGRVIECYSLPSRDIVNLKASYIARPSLPSAQDETIDAGILPDALVAPLEWLTASKAFGARGNTNGMQVCLQNAQNLLI